MLDQSTEPVGSNTEVKENDENWLDNWLRLELPLLLKCGHKDDPKCLVPLAKHRIRVAEP